MGCVDVHTCVCLPINVSLMRFLCWFVLLHSRLFGFLFAFCFLKRKMDGAEWDGWESLGGNGEGELTLNCTKTLFSIKK